MPNQNRLEAWEDYVRAVKADLAESKKLVEEISEKLARLHTKMLG